MDPKDEIKKVEENESLEKNQQEDINHDEDDQDDILARKLAKEDFANFGKRMKKMKEEDENE